ncbi:MAG: lasso peptide biosynthesis B2 protein [Chroococcidiopsidaceae cyanobacterium CP_BM_ER_R8_30]|nr:lasso peptide biosynthesis B2 protein [Chroococcidiopsidaceae cyanobacterium CP_BM_ER_R8_30]
MQKNVNYEEEDAYCLGHEVFLFARDETLQILDFYRGQFYGLNPTASRMLSLVLEQGAKVAVTSITQIYGVTLEQACADLTNLLKHLEERKLLFPISKRNHYSFSLFRMGIAKINIVMGAICLWLLKKICLVSKKLLNPQPHPNLLIVELLLRLSWLSFRFLGWRRAIAVWRLWHCTTATVDPVFQKELVDRLDSIVREAAAGILFLPMVCKERALVGYHLLHTFYGLSATLVVGVNPYPFQLHAWVECNGQIVTDDPTYCQPFIPLTRYS